MRRFSIGFIVLLLQATAYANTISLNTVSADATPGGINANFTTLANAINGNIEGSSDGTSVLNIKADSVYEINMANDANPRVFASELLGVGSDSFSSGTLTQNAVVESGCVPADDSDLTSDVSACVAYVNGYRVSKSAESVTYTASRDTYLDLTQAGVYTKVEVANGATQPAVTANSVRLATVVTNGTEITSVTNLFTTRVPGLIIPSNYRDGLIVSRDSATTITVGSGSAEINNTMVSKTTLTTLTTSTASDWAGGSSLRAADTFAYVGMDTSGNLKMHTTAPSHDNYAVSTTAGKKRYATWSSTVYRILGWFYMDGNGSGNVEVASNIKEHGLNNSVQSIDTAVLSYTGTTFADTQRARFYSSGGPVMLMSTISGDASGGGIVFHDSMFQRGSTNLTDGQNSMGIASDTYNGSNVNIYLDSNVPQASTTYDVQHRISANTLRVKGRKLIVREE